MSGIAFLFALVGLFAIVIVWRLARRGRSSAAEWNWLPKELRGAELRFAEKTFKIRSPIALSARVDRAYALGTEIRLLEFKTRANQMAYRSDMIELSAQRIAIKVSTGAQVSDIGYVLTQDRFGKKRVVHRVRLMELHDLVAIVNRRAGILSGLVEPSFPESARLCQKCSFQNRCRLELQGGNRQHTHDQKEVPKNRQAGDRAK